MYGVNEHTIKMCIIQKVPFFRGAHYFNFEISVASSKGQRMTLACGDILSSHVHLVIYIFQF